MKGTRPLTTDEIIAVSNQFDGMSAVLNRSLFLLGVSVSGESGCATEFKRETSQVTMMRMQEASSHSYWRLT